MKQFLAVGLLSTVLALYPAVVVGLLVSDINPVLAYLVGGYVFLRIFGLAYSNSPR